LQLRDATKSRNFVIWSITARQATPSALCKPKMRLRYPQSPHRLTVTYAKMPRKNRSCAPLTLKQKIITRDEVRLNSRGAIATLPKRGCRASRRPGVAGVRFTTYLPIKSLWLPLVRRLKVEMPQPWGSSASTCMICGKPFFFAWLNRYQTHYLYSICSDRCAAERRNAPRRERRRSHAEARRRDMTERTCGHCGAPLGASRATKRYCSVRCRVAAYRAGRAEELR
jgi:hypothetical protein